MRHTAADWCYLDRSGLSPAEYYQALARLGFAGAEMVAPANRAAVRAAGLELSTMSMPDLERGLNHRAHHATLVPAIHAALDEARAAGVSQLIVFSGRRQGLSEADGISACVEGLRGVAAHAQETGVTVLLEVLSEQDHPDQQCSRMAFAKAVIEAVGSPAVRVLYDLYHGALMGDEPRTWDARTFDLIGHVHVAACDGRSCPRLGATPDYRSLVPVFLAAGYRGRWGHEFLPRGEVLAELADSKRFIESVRAREASGSA